MPAHRNVPAQAGFDCAGTPRGGRLCAGAATGTASSFAFHLARIVARLETPGTRSRYTGTRTALVCSSRPRGPAAAAGGRTPPRNPPCAGRAPREPETPPTILGRRLGALLRRRGGRAGSKLECVEFPAGWRPRQFGAGDAGWRLGALLRRRGPGWGPN